MKIHELMTTDVKSCAPGDSLNEAAHLMWTHDCGSIPVTDESARVVGMLTDRDICMAAYTRGKALAEVRVAEVMSTGVHAVGPHEELALAEQVMAAHQVRRLPVIDEDGRLVGLVSFNDLARQAAREVGRRKPALAARDLSVALGAICRPRTCLVSDKPTAARNGHRAGALILAS